MSNLWQAIRHPRIALRLQLIVASSLVCLVALGALALVERYNAMWDARVDKLRAITEQAISIAADFDRQVQAGNLTRDQAIQQFRDAIRPIRYDGGSGYFFAHDMDGKTLVLGPTPAVEGTNRIEIKDADGKVFVREMVQAASRGGGIVIYQYPKPGSTIALPKAAYVLPISAWNMFVGTGLYVDDLRSDAIASGVKFGALVGLLLVGCAVVAWLVSRGVTRPLARLRHSMALLARGDLGAEIAGTDRHDELGEMAAAVQVFKDNATEITRLKAEQEAADRLAALEKERAMTQLASGFESNVGTIVDAVASAATEMQATAASMTATAEQASRQATAVAAAAELASANVQSVAGATEQMSSSVAEIGRQVANSSAVTAQAVTESEHTNTLVNGLATAAQKIGAVTNMIQEIASQTNLLALNATIEAARAGDAGKGFAVVASEVKNLASQTAKATEEISAQISAMQSTTSDTVAAIQSIGTTINQINEIVTTIAAAVEEQGAATREIAHNVQQAAAGTTEVSININGVTQAVGDTGAAASSVLGAADELSRQAEALRNSATQFITKVKAA